MHRHVNLINAVLDYKFAYSSFSARKASIGWAIRLDIDLARLRQSNMKSKLPAASLAARSASNPDSDSGSGSGSPASVVACTVGPPTSACGRDLAGPTR